MSEPAATTSPFYVTGGTLKPGEPSYVERRADAELYQSLLAGELCYVLTSRQLGKSSLMARTAVKLARAGVRSATVDLASIGGERRAQTAAQWYFGIANEIHRRLEIPAPLRPWWQERADLPPIQRLTELFRELVLGHCPGRVVVFVDEIDSTLGLPFTDDFFAALRACFNARATDPVFERLTFALLGVATPGQLIRDPARTPFNVGRQIQLDDFRPEEAAKLAPGLHADAGEAARRLQRILYWTGGHPYLTQALCRAVREAAAAAPPGAPEAVVDPLVQDRFLASRARSEEAKANLEPVRARLERPGAQGRRLLGTYRRVRLGEAVADQPSSPLVAQLKLTGVVKATDEGRLAVRNRIYELVFTAEWARAAMPASRSRQLAAVLAAGAAGALVWFAAFQPRPYEAALRAAIADDAFVGADAAYTVLHANPFSRARATALMQQFWEHRALRYALAGARDESLLCYLQGLQLGESVRLRRAAQNLIGSDYGRLLHTLRHAEAGAAPNPDARGRGTRFGISDPRRFVEGVAYSPAGDTVATVSGDGTARLWDARSGRALAPVMLAPGGVGAVAFSRDGSTLATVSTFGRTVRLWDARSGKPIAEPVTLGDSPTIYRLRGLAVSAHAGAVAIASGDTVGTWNLRTGKPLAPPFRVQGEPQAVALSPDGRTLVTGTGDASAELWDVRTRRPIASALGHRVTLGAAAFSPDGGTVATASRGTARQWDARTGRPTSPALQQLGTVLAVAASRDGGTLATGCWDGTAWLWDGHAAALLAPALRSQPGESALALSPDGRTLVTGSAEGAARLWDAHGGEVSAPAGGGRGAFLHAVALSPDGRTAATGAADHTAWLWDARTGRVLSPLLRHGGPVRAVAFSPDGQVLATGSEDGTARLWDAHTGRPVSPPLQHRAAVRTVAFSPDGRVLATAADDQTARLWDARTGMPLSPALPHEVPLYLVVFSPDGHTLATGSKEGMRLWNAPTGKPLAPVLELMFVSAIAFSPDSRTIATVSATEGVRLLDARTGKAMGATLPTRGGVSVAFSPDGRAVATGSLDGSLQLWDARSGKPMGSAFQLQSGADTIAFKPGGTDLLVATSQWLKTFSWDGRQAVPTGSQLLHGLWRESFRFPAECAHCAQAALMDSASSVHVETLDLAWPTDPPLAGDAKELLDRWQRTLALKFDDQMQPVPR